MTMPLVTDPKINVPVPFGGFHHAAGYRVAQNLAFGRKRLISDHATLLQYGATRYDRFSNADFLTGNGELERYRDNGNHLFYDDYMSLVLRVPGVEQQYESGMFTTHYSQKTGLWSARGLLPRTLSSWSAFWILPATGWPPEVDFPDAPNNSWMNNYGDSATRPHFASVQPTGPRLPPMNGAGSYRDPKLDGQWSFWDAGIDFSQRWAWYMLEWTREAPPGSTTVTDRFDFYVCPDGETVAMRIRTDFYPWLHNDGTDGGPAYFIADLAIGDWSDRSGISDCDGVEFKISDVVMATPV